MLDTLIFIGIALLSAIIAIVYRKILAYQPVLSWWFKFGLDYSNKWFYQPIWGCEKCFAGQLTLWFYLLSIIGSKISLFSGLIFYIIPDVSIHTFNLFTLVLGVCVAVGTTHLFNYLTNKHHV